jgi:hypothetical protein
MSLLVESSATKRSAPQHESSLYQSCCPMRHFLEALLQQRCPRPATGDRADAGLQLASHMDFLRDQDVVVLGLPRGTRPTSRRCGNSISGSASPDRCCSSVSSGLPIRDSGSGSSSASCWSMLSDGHAATDQGQRRSLLDERLGRTAMAGPMVVGLDDSRGRFAVDIEWAPRRAGLQQRCGVHLPVRFEMTHVHVDGLR